MTSVLHAQRIAAVLEELRGTGATSVLDLGCGEGVLLAELAVLPGFTRLTGIDPDARAIEAARTRIADLDPCRHVEIDISVGSLTDAPERFTGFDAAVMLEVIEHIEPSRLHALERAVFATMRPPTVIMTTPNSEYNAMLGVPPGRFRHPDHRFEWDRERFATWAAGVAGRVGYRVHFRNIPAGLPSVGGPSQMAVFRLNPHEAE